MKVKLAIRILSVILILGILASCSSKKLITTESGKEIDKRLIGNWKGCETGQQFESMTKCWNMNRNKDGTFVLLFKVSSESNEFTSKEVGSWWIEKGEFHEYHNNTQKTDIYNYTVVNKNEILFESIQIYPQMTSESYKFTDYREGSKMERELFDIRDGSSFDQAIKVKSISEEYEFIRNNCIDCKSIQQSLVFEKKKPYDIIDVEKPDGTKVSYYFDISSFYGKGF